MKFRRSIQNPKISESTKKEIEKMVGYRAITRGVDPKQVVIYSFEQESSIGRVCSQLVKSMILREKTDPKRVYLIEDPSSLTFSSSLDFLLEKYKLKFNAGGKSKGPYYKKSIYGIFKLILRTMMKYKRKHKDLYKKICVVVEPHEYEGQREKITVRSSRYNRTIQLSELVKRL